LLGWLLCCYTTRPQARQQPAAPAKQAKQEQQQEYNRGARQTAAALLQSKQHQARSEARQRRGARNKLPRLVMMIDTTHAPHLSEEIKKAAR